MYALRYRSQLPPVVQKELDGMTSTMTVWGSLDHDEDGRNLDGVPVGAMVDWPVATPPARWLLCNGAAYSRTTYKALFRVIGVTQGIGDGSTTFNVPTSAGQIIYAGV